MVVTIIFAGVSLSSHCTELNFVAINSIHHRELKILSKTKESFPQTTWTTTTTTTTITSFPIETFHAAITICQQSINTETKSMKKKRKIIRHISATIFTDQRLTTDTRPTDRLRRTDTSDTGALNDPMDGILLWPGWLGARRCLKHLVGAKVLWSEEREDRLATAQVILRRLLHTEPREICKNNQHRITGFYSYQSFNTFSKSNITLNSGLVWKIISVCFKFQNKKASHWKILTIKHFLCFVV